MNYLFQSENHRKDFCARKYATFAGPCIPGVRIGFYSVYQQSRTSSKQFIYRLETHTRPFSMVTDRWRARGVTFFDSFIINQITKVDPFLSFNKNILTLKTAKISKNKQTEKAFLHRLMFSSLHLPDPPQIQDIKGFLAFKQQPPYVQFYFCCFCCFKAVIWLLFRHSLYVAWPKITVSSF